MARSQLPAVFEFQGVRIRSGGSDRAPWFVAKDVCEVLGITNQARAMAELDDDERGIQNCMTPGGRQDLAVVYESGLYALAMQSKKGKPFRKWVTSEVLPAIRRTGEYRAKRQRKYEQQNLPLAWIQEREDGIEVRKSFTDTLKDHEVAGAGYARCTDATYTGLFKQTAVGLRMKMGLPTKGVNVRDHLTMSELSRVKLSEDMAAQKIEKDDVRGNAPCATVCRDAGRAIADTFERFLSAPPKP